MTEYDMEEVQRIYEEGMNEKRSRISFEYERSYDQDYIYELAAQKGWYENKVQVKKFTDPALKDYWVIEPYEEDCTCPNLVEPPAQTEEN